MRIIIKLKNFWNGIQGYWIEDVVNGIKCSTSHLCDRIDDLRDRVIIDDEDDWMNRDVKWPPNHHERP